MECRSPFRRPDKRATAKPYVKNGTRYRDRTYDFLLVRETLYQLS